MLNSQLKQYANAVKDFSSMAHGKAGKLLPQKLVQIRSKVFRAVNCSKHKYQNIHKAKICAVSGNWKLESCIS